MAARPRPEPAGSGTAARPSGGAVRLPMGGRQAPPASAARLTHWGRRPRVKNGRQAASLITLAFLDRFSKFLRFFK